MNTNGNGYYKPSFIIRAKEWIGTTIKHLPETQFNAMWIAVAFFVILVAFFEYKVYEATLTQTGDAILSISVLTVTAAGGLVSELFLHRNKKATDDQRFQADLIFYISIVTSAIAGFAVWAQSSGLEYVDLAGYRLTLPAYGQFVFTTITIVSIIDALLLRAYIRGDVDNQHSRNVNRIDSLRREADLGIERDLMNFRTQVKTTSERRLKIEQERAKMRKELNSIYGGSVPGDVMAKAMRELDEITTDAPENTAKSKGSGSGNQGQMLMRSYASDTKMTDKAVDPAVQLRYKKDEDDSVPFKSNGNGQGHGPNS